MKYVIGALVAVATVFLGAIYCTLLDLEERCKYEDFDWEEDDYYG